MIRRPSRYLGSNPVKSQRRQIEFIDKDVDHLNRIVLVDPVRKAFRKQRRLLAIDPLNEALHAILFTRIIALWSEFQQDTAFLHSQGPGVSKRLIRDVSDLASGTRAISTGFG